MRKRKKEKFKPSKRRFERAARPHKMNNVSTIRRGGIRL